jgi:hypothetical protein
MNIFPQTEAEDLSKMAQMYLSKTKPLRATNRYLELEWNIKWEHKCICQYHASVQTCIVL